VINAKQKRATLLAHFGIDFKLTSITASFSMVLALMFHLIQAMVGIKNFPPASIQY
jgi:hypothetical protein